MWTNRTLRSVQEEHVNMFTSCIRPIQFHSFSKIHTVELVEGRTIGSVNSIKWCKLESAGTILCQEARLRFRRCKMPVPRQLSVTPPLKHVVIHLYFNCLTLLFFITFISMNLIVFVFVNIALKMQSFFSSVIVYSLIYTYMDGLLYSSSDTSVVTAFFLSVLENVCY